MRLSDLLGATVRAADGRTLGRLCDVRVVRDGPLRSNVQAGYRVDAVLVGRGGVAERLGFVRHHIGGPWLLRVIATRLERELVTIPAAAVAHWDDGQHEIRLHPERTDEAPGSNPAGRNGTMLNVEELLDAWWASLDETHRIEALAAPLDDPPGWAVAAVVARIVEHSAPDDPDTTGLTARAATLLGEFLDHQRVGE